jgi:hypothetical protein
MHYAHLSSSTITISAVIRIARLQWAGYVSRTDDICMPRRLTYMQREWVRKMGRMNARWKDGNGKGYKDAGN